MLHLTEFQHWNIWMDRPGPSIVSYSPALHSNSIQNAYVYICSELMTFHPSKTAFQTTQCAYRDTLQALRLGTCLVTQQQYSLINSFNVQLLQVRLHLRPRTYNKASNYAMFKPFILHHKHQRQYAYENSIMFLRIHFINRDIFTFGWSWQWRKIRSSVKTRMLTFSVNRWNVKLQFSRTWGWGLLKNLKKGKEIRPTVSRIKNHLDCLLHLG